MNIDRFDLFIDQQECFRKALSDYDPHIWYPPLRGGFKEDNPSNWFICFVPAAWGHWEGAIYGVHFGFMYARSRGHLPERFRLAVGVENPMQHSQRQAFKEEVISRVTARGIPFPGFVLQAKVQTKLLEADPIPFGNQSWHISLKRYIALQPLVEVVGIVVREYYDRGAFDAPMNFPS